MVTIKYKDSNYRFTDPIRYFKANDPIYFEVENIPLKQLQENDLWLKDQITNGLKIDEIDRSGFSELKPYSTGTDNVVKVKPGRFIARINDAYSITPLQKIRNLLGQNINEYNTWAAEGSNGAYLDVVLEKFKNQLSNLDLNGLSERVLAWPAYSPGRASQYLSEIYNLGFGTTFPTGVSPLPVAQGVLFPGDTEVTEYIIKQYEDGDALTGFASLGNAETAFIKRWRGVARTAVVDLSEETSLEIPPFNAEDFFYIDENGVKQLISGANQRIDLLFIYSKPVDASSTTIAKFTEFSQPTTITKPELGIVYGAGLGVDFRKTSNDIRSAIKQVDLIDQVGTSKMLAFVGDSLSVNNGFSLSNVHGSFPAPDDLMNIAPMLDINLRDNHFALVGQTVLPLAYIVVKAGAAVNENNQSLSVISNNDIIDIRPFFRTTELTYNERAGLAAAIPAPSLANPVVTQAELDFEVKRSYQAIQARLNSIQNTVTVQTTPRVVGAGYVKGGYNFGVEGTLARYIELRLTQGNLTKERLKSEVISRFGLPLGIEIPDFPDWDIGAWVVANNLSEQGSFPNDYMNVYQSGGYGNVRPTYANTAVEFAPYQNKELTTRLERLGTDNITGKTGHTCVFFVKKKIYFNRGSIPWMNDYHVDVQLWNCAPLGCRAQAERSITTAGTNSVWVEKSYNYFTIYVAWVASDYNFGNGKEEIIENINNSTSINLPNSRRNGSNYAGFLVMTDGITNAGGRGDYNQTVFNGEGSAGIAIYPSVTFKITGYPVNYNGLNLNLNADNPTLTLA